jgi:hypothetical protein
MRETKVENASTVKPALRPGGGVAVTAMAVALAFALFTYLSIGAASAQVLERGLEGGVLGAIVGGAVGGGKGVGRGAAIGAGVGVAAGAVERNNQQRYYTSPPPPPPPQRYYGGPPPSSFGNLVAKTQVSLNRLGYNPGPVDGQMGPGTSNAIRNYQYAWGLPVTGAPSYPLLDHMRAHGG